MFSKAKTCKDCFPLKTNHFQNWVQDLMELWIEPIFNFLLSKNLFNHLGRAVDKMLILLNLMSLEENFSLKDINPITALFMESAKRRGIKFQVMKNYFGYTNYFQMNVSGGDFTFEILPQAESDTHNELIRKVDDKWIVKLKLKENGLPVAEGRSFWWFNTKKAIKWANEFGYPLIIKPRLGYASQHVYYNITNQKDLSDAIKGVVKYSPIFIIERFMPNLNLFRITAIDTKNFFISKRSPVHIIADGINTIKELIQKINFPEGKINMDVLKESGLTLQSIPEKGRIVHLHNKIILSLGANFEETLEIHPDNKRLFEKITRLFPHRLMGIDFICEDMKKSWSKQNCAVLELNTIPNIQMHSFPHSDGRMKNKAAEAITDLVFKYYK